MLRAFICAVGRRHLRASLCDSSLDQASEACSRVFRALFAIDQQLALHLQALGVSAVVCLSWILTLFTHPLSGHTSQVAEVLDFIFASDDDYLVLLCAFVIADNSQLLMQIRDGGEAYTTPFPPFFFARNLIDDTQVQSRAGVCQHIPAAVPPPPHVPVPCPASVAVQVQPSNPRPRNQYQGSVQTRRVGFRCQRGGSGALQRRRAAAR